MNEFDKFFSDLLNTNHHLDTENTFTYDNIKDTDFSISSLEVEEINKYKKNIDSVLNELFFTKTNCCHLKLSISSMIDIVNVLFNRRLDFSLGDVMTIPFGSPSFKDLLAEQFIELLACMEQSGGIHEYTTISSRILALFLTAQIPCVCLRSGHAQEYDVDLDDVFYRKTSHGKHIWNQLKNSGVDIEAFKAAVNREDDEKHVIRTMSCVTVNSFMLHFEEGDYSDYVKIRYLNNPSENDNNIIALTIHFRNKTSYENFIRPKKRELYNVFKSFPEHAEDIIKFYLSDFRTEMNEFHNRHAGL